MLNTERKIHTLLFGVLWLACNILTAGFAPSNISSYWGDSELIAIGSVGKAYEKIHGKTARYHLTIKEVIRGPELKNLKNIEILNPAHANSNSRWNTGLPGTQSVFFGKWNDEEQIWVVPRAAQLHDSLLEAIRIMQYVDSSKDDNEREERLAESFQKHEVETFFYLLSEARRLDREDLILEHYQRRFRRDPTDLRAADELLRRDDLNALPKLIEYLEDTEFEPRRHGSARGEIAQMISKRLRKDATDILRPYIKDKDEFVALAVAVHEMDVESDSEKWEEIFRLAQSTTNRIIRHNACYDLVSYAPQIPLEGLEQIRNYVHKNEVSVAILARLNLAIKRRKAEPDASGQGH